MTSSEKNFLKVMTEGFKNLTTQLVAYKEAVELLRQNYPKEAATIDAAQIRLVTSPDVQAIVHSRFDVALEKLFQQDPESLSGSEALSLLQTILQKQKPN
jgi:hypothetical protein